MTASMYGSLSAVDWINVKTQGATGNGTTDDTTAVQAAITAAQNAGGGVVYFPAGTYLVSGLSVTGNNVRLVGDGKKASTLKKKTAGTLLSMSGPSSDPTGATHVRYCSVEHLGFNGNSLSGLIFQLYYCDNLVFRDVFITSNADICIDGVEFWDSRFFSMVIESSTGAANASAPNVMLRCSAAASGFGYSSDNTNQIHFIGCRWENFGTGALWVIQGTGSSNGCNGIYVTDCKMETSSMQGGPHLKADSSSSIVYVNGLYCYAGGFASGYSTAQNIVVWSAQNSALENVLIGNSTVATINSGFDVFSGASSTTVLRNLTGHYTTAPSGSHIYFEASSTSDFVVDNCYSSSGSTFGGTIPTKWYQNRSLRQVAGPVSDASFTHAANLNGVMAVDSTNFNLYTRIGGSWYYVPVSTGGNFPVSNNLYVGSSSSLGDNGAGEIQLHDATTVPTTNPTAGIVVYSESSTPHPLKLRDTSGNVRSLVDGFFQLASSPTFTSASQTATPVTLTVAASATYLMEAGLIFSNTTGSTTPSWTGPTGATMQWNDTGASLDYSSTIGATNNSYASNAGTRMAFFKGLLVTSTTAGSLTLTLGVSAGTTTLSAGSYLRLTRVK